MKLFEIYYNANDTDYGEQTLFVAAEDMPTTAEAVAYLVNQFDATAEIFEDVEVFEVNQIDIIGNDMAYAVPHLEVKTWKLNDFMNTLYDVLAQNQVGQGERDEITEVVDHVDLDRNAIVFKLNNGREFELLLVDTYAPAPEGAN